MGKAFSHPFIEPSKRAFPERLADIYVALQVARDAVRMIELAHAMTSVSTKRSDHFKRVAIQDLHLLITAVRYVDEALLFVGREHDVEGGSFGGRCLPFYISFFDKLPFDGENLYAIVDAVTDVDQIVAGNADAVYGVELL